MIASSTYGYAWTDPGSGYPLAPVGYTYAYRYDGRGQLVTADNSLGSAWDVGVGAGNTLQYDPSGNMTRFNTGSVTRTYTYTAGTNRFSHSTERLNGYDASGRVTSIEGHAQGYQSFQIDPYWGKATRIAGEQTVAYRFGAAGQRVGMTADPDGPTPHRTMYIHGLGAEPLVERRNQGPHPVTRHVYGPAGLLAIHEGPDGTVWFPLKDNLGSTRVVFSRSGTVLSWTDYYPFGGILPGRSGTSAIDHDNIKFTGYEKESEGGLDTYHAEARGYDPVIGRFTGRDPHAQHYPDWSPYHYAANNPVLITDPTGMDWYSSNDGAVKWVEGSDEIEGYTNIGANYTHNIGGGISITYNQNVAESIMFTAMGAEGWVSQIANGINCYEACTTMLSNEGTTTAGRSSEVVMTNTGENGRAGSATANTQGGLSVLNKNIENGRPVIVGVDYKSGSPNADGMTDHFVVVSGKTETLSNGRVTTTSYRFFDPRTSHSSYGTQATNQFRLQNNRLVGTYQQGARINFNYTVTAIRRNR